MTKIDKIRETVQEAYEFQNDLNCDLIGLYNYVRYGNQDFGSDMCVNAFTPITDKSKIQHYYLTCFISEGINRKQNIPKEFIQMYLDKRNLYNDKQIIGEIENIEKNMI